MKDYNAVDELLDEEEVVHLNVEELTTEEQSQILSKCVFVGCNTVVYCCLVDSDGVKLVWKDKIANNSALYRYLVCTHLSVSRNQLYVASKNSVACYEPLTGKIVWTVRPDFQNGVLTYKLLNTLMMTRDESLLLCAANNILVALDPSTGQTVRRIKFGKYIVEPATVILEHNGAIVVGCAGRVKAFNISTGELLWKNRLSGFGDQPVSLSSYFHNNANCIIVGTSGYIIILDGQTGNKIKDVNLKGLFPVSLLVDSLNGFIYTLTSKKLRCFQGENLETQWNTKLNYSSYGSALAFVGNTIITARNGKVAAHKKSSDEIIWQTELPQGTFVGKLTGEYFVSVATTPNTNYFICACYGKLYGINSEGAVLWTYGLESAKLGVSSSLSTVSYNTDFNSTCLPHHIQLLNQQFTDVIDRK